MRRGLSIAFVYIGLVIGAGFASGKEILHFFSVYGNKGLDGIILASILFFVVAYIILSKIHKDKIKSFEEYVSRTAGKWAGAIRIFITLFMFAGFIVMLSGSGALLNNLFGLPNWVGIWIMAMLCFLVFSFDVQGFVMLNSILVPIMICGITYIAVTSAIFSDTSAFYNITPFFDMVKNNFLVSAICYASYNTITAAAVLVPLHQSLNKRSITVAALTGGVVLGIMIFLIWYAIKAQLPALIHSDIPLFDLAAQLGEIQKSAYGLILFFAIYTTAASQGFGLLEQIKNRVKVLTNEKRRPSNVIVCSGALCLAAIPFAYAGFSHLVETLYSAFGYAGIVWMAFIIFKGSK